MPSHAVIATLLQTHATRSLEVYVAGRRITGDVRYDSLSITDGGTSSQGRASFHLADVAISSLSEVYDQAQVRIVDHAAGDDIFRGYIISRRPIKLPRYKGVEIIASDIGSLLDDAFVVSESRPAESLQARIGYLWGKFATHDLSRDMSKVGSFGGTLPAQLLAGLTLRQAIEATISQASSSGDYYVDMTGRLHVFTSEVNNAPYNIDADSPGAGEIAPQDLTLDYDSASYANAVYVQGVNAAGSGLFIDHAALANANGVLRTVPYQAPDCSTAAMARSMANMYLGRVSSARPRGTFSTASPKDGWRSGQNVTITSSDLGLTNQSYRIHRVTTTVLVGGATPTRRYEIEFGGSRAGTLQ